MNSNQISVYAASKFRIDINNHGPNVFHLIRQQQIGAKVSTPDGSSPNDNYEILMELNTTDGRKQKILFDVKSLIFLHDQLDALTRTFPKCYVYADEKR